VWNNTGDKAILRRGRSQQGIQRVAPCCAGARQALLENVPREVCLISRCRVGLASSNARCSTSFGPAGSVTPEWIDGGTAPYHRPPSRAGVYGDRSRRRLLDRGDSADCGCRGLAVRPATTRIPGKSARRRPRRICGHCSARGPRRRCQSCSAQLRWRVPLRWYLVALFTVPVGATLTSLAIFGPRAVTSPPGGWLRALAEVAAVFALQLVLFQLAEEIGFTGFLQHHWQDRYHSMKLTLYVALLWAVWACA
jgi:hypothetical protein